MIHSIKRKLSWAHKSFFQKGGGRITESREYLILLSNFFSYYKSTYKNTYERYK